MIKIELYRLIKNKKNILIMLAMCLFSGLLVIQLHQKAIQYDESRRTEYYNATSVAKAELEELKNLEDSDEVKNEKEYWRKEQSMTSTLGQKYHPMSNGEDMLSNNEKITYEKERYENLLIGKDKGYNDSYLLLASTEKEIKKEIIIREYLLENSIEQYDTPYEMNLMNYLVHLFDSPNIFIFLIFISLICIDSLSNDFDCNSYKTIYTLPISRSKIIFSKMIAGMIVSIVSVGISLVLPSIYTLLSTGIGISDYPLVLDTFEVITVLNYFIEGIIVFSGLVLFMVSLITLLSVILRAGTPVLMAIGSIFIILYCMSEMSFEIPLYLSYIPVFSVDIASAINIKNFSTVLFICSSALLILMFSFVARLIIMKADLIGGDE